MVSQEELQYMWFSCIYQSEKKSLNMGELCNRVQAWTQFETCALHIRMKANEI